MPFITKRQRAKAKCSQEIRQAVQMRKIPLVYLHPHRTADLLERRIITIIDQATSSTICQRISPTSVRAIAQIRAIVKEGIELKKELFQLADAEKDVDSRHGSNVVSGNVVKDEWLK